MKKKIDYIALAKQAAANNVAFAEKVAARAKSEHWKYIGDYPAGTRLSATLLGDPDGEGWDSWNDLQRKWLREHTGKKIKGMVKFMGGAYLRPDGCNVVVLTDDEILIHRRLPKKRK